MYKLFKSFCMSLYGSVLWDFTSKVMDRFYTAWRKSIRYIIRLPYRTHSVLLALIVDDLPVNVQLYKRFMKFIRNVVNHENKVIALCSKLAIHGSNSSVCKNINFLSKELKISKFQLINEKSKFNSYTEKYIKDL